MPDCCLCWPQANVFISSIRHATVCAERAVGPSVAAVKTDRAVHVGILALKTQELQT